MQRGATARRVSFRLPSFVCREYQVISDYSDTSNDESRSTGVTNPRGALHPPVEFRGGHNDAPGTVPNVITIDGQPGGSGRGRPARGVSNHTKRGEVGASGDGKLMGPRDEALIEPLAFQRERVSVRVRRGAPAPAFHENPQSRPALQWPRG